MLMPESLLNKIEAKKELTKMNTITQVRSPLLLSIVEPLVDEDIIDGLIDEKDRQKEIDSYFSPSPEDQAELLRKLRKATTGVS